MSNIYNDETHEYFVDGNYSPSVTEIAKPISFEKLSRLDEAILNKARLRGTAVHEYAQLYLLIGELDEEEIPSEYYPYVKQFKDWVFTYKPKVLFTEYRMFSPDFSGTCDLICEIDGETVLVDYKTTSAIDIKSLSVQLAGYSILAEKYGIHIDRAYSLHLKKDSWTFKERGRDYEWFNLLLIHNKKMRGVGTSD